MRKFRFIAVVVAVLIVPVLFCSGVESLKAEDLPRDPFEEYDEAVWGGPCETPMPSRVATPMLVPAGGGPAVHKSSMPPRINTNWDDELGYIPGGTDADPNIRYAAGTPGLPTFPCSITDRYCPTREEIRAVIDACENHSDDDDNFKITGHNSIGDLIIDGSCPNVQVVFNYTRVKKANDGTYEFLGKACYNLYFPPHFNARTIIPNKYGILFLSCSWHVSNNYPFFVQYTHDAALSTFRSWRATNGLHPYVVVRSNTGGLNCLGNNLEYLEDASKIIEMLCERYNCNRNELMFSGRSRGSSSSGIMAENRNQFYPYKAIYVLTGGAFSVGKMEKTPLSTKPAVNMVIHGIFDQYARTRYTYDPPPADPDQDCHLLEYIMDTVDYDEANSLSADTGAETIYDEEELAYLNPLKDTYVVVGGSSHDGFMNYAALTAFTRKLEYLGVNHFVGFRLRKGHAGHNNINYKSKVENAFIDAYLEHKRLGMVFDPSQFNPNDYMDEVKVWSGITREESVNYYLRENYWEPSADSDVICLNPVENPSEVSFPLVVSMPYKLGREVTYGWPRFEPGRIDLIGEEGRSWIVKIMAQNEDASEEYQVAEHSGEFGEDPDNFWRDSDTIFWWFEGPEDSAFGTPPFDVFRYRVEVWYEDANGIMQNVSASNFTQEHGVPASPLVETVMEIQDYQPLTNEYFMFGDLGLAGNQILGVAAWDKDGIFETYADYPYEP